MKLHSEPVVILGMQRSGTSALAGALHQLGVYFGKPEMLYPADQNNPSGYFEHRKATILNLRCLSEFQLHPTSLGRLPENWQEFPESGSLQRELRDFLTSEFDRRGRWGIKQPVTSLVLPLYLEVFAQLGLRPHYVICVRNPLETMRSEASLDFGDSYRVMASLADRAIGSWLRYTLGPLAELADQTVSVVPYDSFLSDPRRTLEALVSHHSDWSPDSAQWEAAVSSVKSDLRHNRSDPGDLDAYPPLVRRTYEAIAAPEEWQGLHQEFLDMVDLFSDPEPPAKAGLSWFEGSERKVSEVVYDGSPIRQTIRIPMTAPPNTPLNGLLTGRPASIWIWRCVWRIGSDEPIGVRSSVEASSKATPLPSAGEVGELANRERGIPVGTEKVLISPTMSHGIPAKLSTGLASTLTTGNGLLKLNAVMEPGQVGFTTPEVPGPYVLEIEFLAISGPKVSEDSAATLAARLENIVSGRSAV